MSSQSDTTPRLPALPCTAPASESTFGAIAANSTVTSQCDDPAETVRHAIRAGGDTETIAAMAGALAGARHGAAAFPRSWIDRLEAADRIRTLAARWQASPS